MVLVVYANCELKAHFFMYGMKVFPKKVLSGHHFLFGPQCT